MVIGGELKVDLNDMFKRYWPWFSRPGLVLTLFWAAQSAHKLLWVVMLLGLLVIFGLSRNAFVHISCWYRRIHDYPALEKWKEDKLLIIADLEAEVEKSKSRLSNALEEGVAIGAAEVYGEILSKGTSAPRIQFISEFAETVDLVGKLEDEKIQLRARYSVMDIPSKSLLGTVEVVAISVEDDLVHLRCVEATVQAYWEKLADRARAFDNSPPSGIRLVPYVREKGTVTEPITQEFLGNPSTNPEVIE